MPAIHRHGDLRSCGATTVVVGQTGEAGIGDVYANGKLVSVDGDPNTDGAGNLNAGSNKVFVHGIAVVNHTPDSPDSAAPDSLCNPLGGNHCAPDTAQGSPDVFVGD